MDQTHPLSHLPIRPLLALVARSARRLIAPHDAWVGNRAATGAAIGMAESLAAGDKVRADDLKLGVALAEEGFDREPCKAPLRDLAVKVSEVGTAMIEQRWLDADAEVPSPVATAAEALRQFAWIWMAATFLNAMAGGNDRMPWHRRWAARAMERDFERLGNRAWMAGQWGPRVEAISPTWLGELWPRVLADPADVNKLDKFLRSENSYVSRFLSVVDGAALDGGLRDEPDAQVISWFVASRADAEQAAARIASLRAAARRGARRQQFVAFVADDGAAHADILLKAGAITHVGDALGSPPPEDAADLRFRLQNTLLNERAGWVGGPGNSYFADVRLAWRDRAVVRKAEELLSLPALDGIVGKSVHDLRRRPGGQAVTTEEERGALASMRQA